MEYRQFKGGKLKALVSLYFSNYISKGNSATFSDFEAELGISKGHPEIRKLFRYLLEIDVFITDKQIHSIKTYYVDKKLLKEVIDSQEILELHVKYIEKVAILWK